MARVEINIDDAYLEELATTTGTVIDLKQMGFDASTLWNWAVRESLGVRMVLSATEEGKDTMHPKIESLEQIRATAKAKAKNPAPGG